MIFHSVFSTFFCSTCSGQIGNFGGSGVCADDVLESARSAHAIVNVVKRMYILAAAKINRRMSRRTRNGVLVWRGRVTMLR